LRLGGEIKFDKIKICNYTYFMTSELQIRIGYESRRSYDDMRDAETFITRQRTTLCTDERVIDDSTLFIFMLSNSLRFQVMQKSFEIGDEPIIQFEFKLNRIARETRDYLKVCENHLGARANFNANVYEEARSDIHDILAKEVDQALKDNKIFERTSMEPSDLSRRIVTSWFRQIAYIEQCKKEQLHGNIGSFSAFYDSVDRQKFGLR